MYPVVARGTGLEFLLFISGLCIGEVGIGVGMMDDMVTDDEVP
jgi:hypothetical protein